MRINGIYTAIEDGPVDSFADHLRQMRDVLQLINQDYRDMRECNILPYELAFREKMPAALDEFADAALEVFHSVKEGLEKMEKDVGETSDAPAFLLDEIEKFRRAVKNLPRQNEGFGFAERPKKFPRRRARKAAEVA